MAETEGFYFAKWRGWIDPDTQDLHIMRGGDEIIFPDNETSRLIELIARLGGLNFVEHARVKSTEEE